MDTDLLNSWLSKAGDPDKAVVEWLEQGAPLGANLDCGVFPDRERDTDVDEDHLEAQDYAELKNYASFRDQPEDAQEEIARLVDKGFLKRVTLEQATASSRSPSSASWASSSSKRQTGR